MPVDEWEVSAGPADYDGPEPEPDESFAAMDMAALAEDPATVTTAVVQECPKRRYIELTLTEDSNGPLKNVRVTLNCPDGASGEGVTDDRGYVRFEGQSTDVDLVEVSIEVKEDEFGHRTLHATVRARQAEAETVPEEPPEFDEWSYHSPGWGGLNV